MLTSEERILELHSRMAVIKEARSRRRYQLSCAAACAVCLAITVAMALFIGQLPVQTAGGIPGGAAASIFADRAVLGYVVVSLLAFCLGSLVTIFCLRLKKHTEESDDRTL